MAYMKIMTCLIVSLGMATVVPTAVSTALDIDLSNISLVLISVSFATMVRFSLPH